MAIPVLSRGEGEIVVSGTTITPLSARAMGAPFFATSFDVHGSVRLQRDYMEILAVTEGQGQVVLYGDDEGQETLALPVGTIVLFRPRDVTRFQRNVEGFSAKYVSFSEMDWELFSNLVGVDRSWYAARLPPRAEFDPHERFVSGVFDEAILRFQHGPTRLDLSRFLTEVLPILFPGYSDPEGAGAPSWLRVAITAMREEDNLRRGLPRLRELAHVSNSYLSVAVRRHYRMTPSALINGVRLSHAATLLHSTDDPIAVVAARCGFANPSMFSRAFRERHRLTPNQFRRRSQGGTVQPAPGAVRNP